MAEGGVMVASIHDVKRPPLVDGDTWSRVMGEAGWRCECTGECGRPHAQTGDRCGVEHGATHWFLVAPVNPGTPFSQTVAEPLMAWCLACHMHAHRRAVAAIAEAHKSAQPDLFGGDVA